MTFPSDGLIAGEQLDYRGLAGAGRTDEEGKLTLIDGQAEIIQRSDIAVFIDHRYILHLNHRFSS